MTSLQSFRIYSLKIGSFFLFECYKNARKTVIELQKSIFLGEDLLQLKYIF
jgi:hypothetical protein